MNDCARKLSGITRTFDLRVKVEWVVQRVALGRIMDTRLKLPFKATCKTLQELEAVGHQVRTHQRLPRVTGVGEVGEDSQIFPGFRVNSPIFSVVLDLEAERVLKMCFPNLALMPHLTLLPNLRTTTDRTGLFRLSPVWINLRPTRRHTNHPMRLTTLNRLGEVINRLTRCPHSSGSVAEPTTLGASAAVVMGMVGLHNRRRNHRAGARTQIRCKEMYNMGSLGVQDSLTLSDDSGTEPPP